MERTYTVWISNADDLNDLMQLGNDLLRYVNLSWSECMEIFRLSLSQGYTCILVREDDDEETNDAETESGEEL